MLESTFQYMQQLRAQRFFLFLEWCAFITKKHPLLGADGLIDCMVKELLACGIEENDLYHLALLDTLMQSGNIVSELYGVYRYIKTAFFKVMEVKGIGNGASHSLLSSNDNGATPQEQFFNHIIAQISPQESAKIKQKFAPINDKLIILGDYLLVLRDHPEVDHKQELYLSRVSYIENLYSYLKVQSELTEVVLLEVSDFINKIRNQSPSSWEFEFIDKISSKSHFERIIGAMTNKLFKFVVFFTSTDDPQNPNANYRSPTP